MANYHLQFDDEDVKNGLLNVDSDGCLKPANKVIFTETLDDGTILCCGKPAKEMTIEEAYKLCQDAYRANALYVDDSRVLSVTNTVWGIVAAHYIAYYSSKPDADIRTSFLGKSEFKTEDA